MIAWAIISGPAAAVGVMNLPFCLIYHPLVTACRLHASLALNILRIICVAILFSYLWSQRTLGRLRVGVTHSQSNPVMAMLVLGFALFLTGTALFVNGSAVVRTSFGQPFGGCLMQESSFWGAFQRRQFVCPDVFTARDRYDFHCVPAPGTAVWARPENVLPGRPDSWFTVCGTDMDFADRSQAVLTFAGVAFLVMLTSVCSIKDADDLSREMHEM